MEIRFFGAARGVTGSCHMLRAGGRTVLLDCGLFQGKRRDAWRRNSRFHFDPERVDAVVQSHAHIDHSGKLPMLVREGFEGEIHATSGTADLCEILLLDCAHILEKDAEYLNKKRMREKVRGRRRQRRRERHRRRREEREVLRDEEAVATLERGASRPGSEILPLYLKEDVHDTLPRFRPHAYGEWFEPVPGMRFRFHDAGHILGSAWVEAELRETRRTVRLVFTGDYGRANMPILRDPEPLADADVYISESTYGDRVHPSYGGMEEDLAAALRRLAERGRGRLIIPAFAVGRTQNLLYTLRRIFDAGRAPQPDVVLDSPLAIEATRRVERHCEVFDAEARALLQCPANGGTVQFCPGVRYAQSVEESKALNRHPGPLVVISASGMMESGRILHHLANHIESPDTEIAIIGFQAAGTLGRRLLDGAKEVNILRERYRVRARITPMLGFSAHADREDLLRALTPHAAGAEVLFLVHGEDDQRRPLAEELGRRGFQRIEEPVEKQAFRV